MKIIFMMFYTFILCFIFINCNKTPTEPASKLTVRTERNAYAGITHIIVVLKNETNKNVYLPECSYHISFFKQRKSENLWTGNSDIVINCKEGLPYNIQILKPKESIQDTILFVDQPGIYRLKYIYGFRNKDIFPDSAFSNEFDYFNPR